MAITNYSVFNPLNEEIVRNLAFVLFVQGHKYTGALERSIRPVVENIGGGAIRLSATALDYIFDLEEGLPPGDPKFNAVDMKKLEAWVKFRQSQGHPTPSAKVLVKKWKKKGFELEGASNYSQLDGQVDRAIQYTFEAYDKDYFEKIDEQIYRMFDEEVQRTKSGTISSKNV